MSTSTGDQGRATIFAGVPGKHIGFYRHIRFLMHDPAALIRLPGQPSLLILRDIETERARRSARADQFANPADFTPESGLSGDRETATAQSVGECLRRAGVSEVWTDRELPMIFAHYIEQAGVTVHCDPELGVIDRRSKDAEEIEHLRTAQKTTEDVMEMACRLVARAEAAADGVLHHDGAPLTSERVQSEIDVFLMRRGYANDGSIVAGGPKGADCHDRGSGPLRTEQPVIIDIFPQDKSTLYHGDCTRCVVHGDIPDAVRDMHAAVIEAKRDAVAACMPGTTGEQVHAAAAAVITARGYDMGLPPKGAPDTYTGMVHGTGHGIGLELHEPPLLDHGGPALVEGEAVTVEPGLYSHAIGGIRIEDMIIVTNNGPMNLNALPEGLDWR
jgi:Xaa-Pro aminopeptidase